MSRSLTGTQSKFSWHGPSEAVAHVIMFHACPDVCLHVVAFRPAVSGLTLTTLSLPLSQACVAQLRHHNVDLEAALLKPMMVMPGAEIPCECCHNYLRRHVLLSYGVTMWT